MIPVFGVTDLIDATDFVLWELQISDDRGASFAANWAVLVCELLDNEPAAS